MKTTSETSEIERFKAWRERTLEEHKDEPEWQVEIIAFFLDLYRQTYPARTFPLMLELWEQSQGEGGKGSTDEDSTRNAGGTGSPGGSPAEGA